jgi:hypothetical protein
MFRHRSCQLLFDKKLYNFNAFTAKNSGETQFATVLTAIA